MSICLANSLKAEAQARLLTYCNEYPFDRVEFTPLMYKVIMHLTRINSAATTQTYWDNLKNVGVFAATVRGNMDSINAKFDKNHTHN